MDIYSSYEFPFRERTHLILTIPKNNTYDVPNGLIKRDSGGRYIVKYNSMFLSFADNPEDLPEKKGTPEKFYIKNGNLVLYPTPVEKGMVTIDYYTLSIGESEEGNEIYSLKKAGDILSVPTHL